MPHLIRATFYGLFFLILSEHVNWQSAAAATFAAYMARAFLTGSYSRQTFPLSKIPALTGLWLRFAGILLREILLANLQVAGIVLKPHLAVAPRLATYTTALKQPALLTAFSTAITLTPGTMTVDISGSTLSIHCLTEAYAAALDSNPLEPVLLKIEEVLNG